VKTYIFYAVLALVLLVYSGVNYYIFNHGWRALAGTGNLRTVFVSVFIVIVVAYPLGRLIEAFDRGGVSNLLVWIGSFWLGALMYFLLAVIAIDLGRLVLSAIPGCEKALRGNMVLLNRWLFGGVVAVVVMVLAFGYHNALHPRVRTVKLSIDKRVPGLSGLHVVMVSDIHLGLIVDERRLADIVARVNSLEPDLVLLVGDVIDEDIGSVVEQGMAATLSMLRAPHGVFAVTGNHEYIGGAEEAVRYIEKAGITVLRDTWRLVDDWFYLVGREDRMASFRGVRRKALDEIMAGVDLSKPVILLDHQPLDLQEAERARVDLQLSGHTHHGQLFPINLITKLVYEQSWGYLERGSTQYYVSSGVGTWGPPVRVGNTPEIVSLVLRFGDSGSE